MGSLPLNGNFKLTNMHSYDTLVEAIQGLRKQGYALDYNLKSASIYCNALDLDLSPEQFHIDETHRFEGDSNPDDSSILFAISGPLPDQKGILVDGYGVSAESLSEAMIQKLR